MDDTDLRNTIAEMLSGDMETEVWPRAETGEQVNAIVARLQNEAGDDLEQKLKIAGFTDYVVEIEDFEQPCETCMYYKVHAKFCELPELMLPVEPEWSCRLWRI